MPSGASNLPGQRRSAEATGSHRATSAERPVWREGMAESAPSCQDQRVVHPERSTAPSQATLPAAVPISFSSSSGAPGYARGTAAGLSQSSHTTSPAHIAVLKSLVRIAAGVLGIVVVGGGLLVGIVYVSINRNPDSSDKRDGSRSAARSKQSDAALPGLRTQSEFTATDKWYLGFIGRHSPRRV